MERALSTTSADYTDAVISSLQNAVYIRLMTPLGSYWADPNLGSKLHLLQREKDLTRVSLLAKQYAQQALQPLLAAKRATSISVTAHQSHDSRCLLHIEVVDGENKRYEFSHYVRV